MMMPVLNRYVGRVDCHGFGLDDDFVCFRLVVGCVADDVKGVLLLHQPGGEVLGGSCLS